MGESVVGVIRHRHRHNNYLNRMNLLMNGIVVSGVRVGSARQTPVSEAKRNGRTKRCCMWAQRLVSELENLPPENTEHAGSTLRSN